jgi:hypothetical protein
MLAVERYVRTNPADRWIYDENLPKRLITTITSKEPQISWLTPKDWRRIDRDRINRVEEFMKWRSQR